MHPSLKRFIEPYRKILGVSLPLVISSSTIMVIEFTDRVFLANYSMDAIAASLPAGMAAFFFISLFMGVVGYVNVFIAQYTGAGRTDRIGTALWQGIWFSAAAWALLFALSFIAEPLFRLGGHPAEVQALEVIYFKTLMMGSGIHILGIGLSCFYMGRGLTRMVMAVNLIGMIVHIPLDYAMINGVWGFPELGMLGAGLASVIAWIAMTLVYILSIFNRRNEEHFKVRSGFAFQRREFLNLLRYGIPGSMQLSLDIFSFVFFIFMMGRIGKIELAASNIVFSLNSLAFMPMVGFSLGTSTLVGQALGRERPDRAWATTVRTIHVGVAYTVLMAVLFLFFPEPVLSLFATENTGEVAFSKILDTGVVLLRFVTVYIFFDAQYMILIGALKGAGDTKFIMVSAGAASLLFIILPLIIGVEIFGAGMGFAWSCLAIFVFFLFLTALWRFRQGGWMDRRVIRE